MIDYVRESKMTIDLTLKEDSLLVKFCGCNELRITSKPLNPCHEKGRNKHGGEFKLEFALKVCEICKTLPEKGKSLFNVTHDACYHAIENSFNHGGNRVAVHLEYTPDKILCTVEDDGDGFDVKETVRKFLTGGEKYWAFGGSGFICFYDSKATIGFNDKGNKTIIFYEVK